MKLLFVYNANSGSINALFDSAHKILSSKTYNCKLCDLTYGVFSEKEQWKIFRKTTNVEMNFLHKDEFLKQFKSKWLPKYEFPVILVEEKAALHIFINTSRLEKIENTTDLIKEINNRL